MPSLRSRASTSCWSARPIFRSSWGCHSTISATSISERLIKSRRPPRSTASPPGCISSRPRSTRTSSSRRGSSSSPCRGVPGGRPGSRTAWPGSSANDGRRGRSGERPDRPACAANQVCGGGPGPAFCGSNYFELGELFAERTQGRTDPDDAPEPPAHPIAEPGDLWVLGRHRLLCGDSTVATDVERVLGGVAPHLMVTDPPYGVNYDPAWRNQAGRSINGTTRRTAAGTVIKPIGARAVGKVVNDDRADWREAWALFPGSVAYIWHAGTKAGIVQDSLAACGFETRSQIIWAKNNFAIGRGHYHCKHEPCWYVVRKGSTASWVGDHCQTTLWQIDKNLKSETGHGTQKPVECMRRPIENNASPGQGVYEPFSGSGTTIIAAEMTGRSCFAIEIDPAYVDVAVLRWQAFSGENAALEGAGRSFTEVAAERQIGSAG